MAEPPLSQNDEYTRRDHPFFVMGASAFRVCMHTLEMTVLFCSENNHCFSEAPLSPSLILVFTCFCGLQACRARSESCYGAQGQICPKTGRHAPFALRSRHGNIPAVLSCSVLGLASQASPWLLPFRPGAIHWWSKATQLCTG